MSFTLNDTFDFIDRRIQQETGSVPHADQLSIIHEVFRELRRNFDVPSSEIVNQFDVFTGVQEYAYPDGAKDQVTLRENYVLNDNSSFKRRSEEDFWRNFNNDNTISESRNGQDRKLLINLQKPKTSHLILNACDTYDGDGTWTADATNSDAKNVTTNSLRTRHTTGSTSFDIDVSQSVNNYAEVYVTGRQKNASSNNLDGVSVMFAWIYFPSAPTAITSIRGQWGNDSSNYFESTPTTPWNGGGFKAGWNLVGFDWQEATESGTVDTSNIDYLNFRLNYSAAQVDMTGVLLSLVVLRERRLMNLHYATDYLVVDSDGVTLKEEFTNTADTNSYVNMDKSLIDWFLYATLEEIFTTHISDPDNRAFFERKRLSFEVNMVRKYPSNQQPPTNSWMEETDLQDFLN